MVLFLGALISTVVSAVGGLVAGSSKKKKEKQRQAGVLDSVRQEMIEIGSRLRVGESNPTVLQAWLTGLDQLKAQAYATLSPENRTDMVFSQTMPLLQHQIRARLAEVKAAAAKGAAERSAVSIPPKWLYAGVAGLVGLVFVALVVR